MKTTLCLILLTLACCCTASAQQTIHITDVHDETAAEHIPGRPLQGPLSSDTVVHGNVGGVTYTMNTQGAASFSLQINADYPIVLSPGSAVITLPSSRETLKCSVRGRRAKP